MVGERVRPGRRRFPPRPSSVREARQMIRESLVLAGREDLVETAELLVSEIVTNALVHAGTAVDVAFSFVDGGLRVEVTDGSPHAPTFRGYGPAAGTGRGLMLLEQMVDAWGVVPEGSGKTVWFQIASRPDLEGGSPAPQGSAATSQSTVAVELLDVPLLLHEAWRQHAESILREYLLAVLDLDGGEDAIAVHAQASDAIALLAEHIPSSGVDEDPERIMVSATEPLVTSPRVTLPVPTSSVQHFATLERTMETALQMAERGMFLTPPTQPEVQAFRAWLCAQVATQSRGGPATPWSASDERPVHRLPTLAWDDTGVRQATTGRIAADDEGHIIALSGAALELLGYADARELIGARLLVMIPSRYQQAHLAGFTMHLLSGRSLLLGRRLAVPVLRRDGSEVEVFLTIHTDRAGDGRVVFVADLDPAAG